MNILIRCQVGNKAFYQIFKKDELLVGDKVLHQVSTTSRRRRTSTSFKISKNYLGQVSDAHGLQNSLERF